MVVWVMVILSIHTNGVIRRLPTQYPTAEACTADLASQQALNLEKEYAICRPLDKR